MGRILATVSSIHEVKDGNELLTAMVPSDAKNPFKTRVMFDNDELAKSLGIYDSVLSVGGNKYTINNGLDFVRNMWQLFSGNQNIVASGPKERFVDIAPFRHKRDSERGEPQFDELFEDVDGQYRRFQERGRQE